MTASKNYRTTGFQEGLGIKAPCMAVAVSNITLSGEQTVNSVAVVVGDRVLVTAQTDAKENGIYNVETAAWVRAQDFDGNRDVVHGTLVPVALAAGYSLYRTVVTGTVEFGTSEFTFVQTLVGS